MTTTMRPGVNAPAEYDHETVMDHLAELPQVQGFRIMLIPVSVEQKTAAGLILPDEVLDKQLTHATVFRVIGVGPAAYSDKERFPHGPYCKHGDYVMLPRYAGTRIQTRNCADLRVVFDDEIMTVVPDYKTVLSLV